jgi:hypothetical protein
MIPCEFGYRILILKTLHLTLFKPKLLENFKTITKIILIPFTLLNPQMK